MVITKLTTRRHLIGMAFAAPLLLSDRGMSHPATPQRIVSMDLLLTELLLTLRIQPLATANVALYRRLVVEPPLDGGVKDLGPLNEPNLEYMRMLQPDLILLADWQVSGLDNLARIAPLMPIAVFPGSTPAVEHGQNLLRRIASETRTQEAADIAIASCDTAISKARDALKDLTRPVYICRFNRDGRNVAVFGGNGMIGDTLVRLGLRNAFTGRVNASGVTSVSLKRLSEVPDAIIVHFDRGQETDSALHRLAESPLWRAYPAVREGRVLRMPVIYPNGGPRSAERLATQLERELKGLSRG